MTTTTNQGEGIMSIDLNAYIEENMTRADISRRGGGMEVDAAEYLGVEDALVSVFQNYLGGGMLGSIGSSANYAARSADPERLAELQEAMKKFFYRLTEPQAEEWDPWSADDYEGIQFRPSSAY
jgi:hypothetical protein